MTDTSAIDDRLLKIVELAKHGVAGERDAAVAAVQRVCLQNGLDFDEVMQKDDAREYVLDVRWRTQDEADLLTQVCFKFALPDGGDLYWNKARKVCIYETTAARHIECCNAAAVYLAAYRKQRKRILKDFAAAFIYKHDIVRRSGVDQVEAADLTLEQRQTLRRQAQLMDTIDHVVIHKAIEAGQ